MSYATRDDVLARAGRVAGAFSVPAKRPNLADLDEFLVDVSADVDEAIRSRGFDPAALDANAQAGLKDLVAYGVLARGLRALGDRSPQVLEILLEADAVWTAAMGDPKATQADAVAGSIRLGTFPVVAALEAGVAGGGSVVSAGQLWDEEANYGRPEQRLAEFWETWGTNLQPTFRRGQKF